MDKKTLYQHIRDINYPDMKSLSQRIQYILLRILGKTIQLSGFKITYTIADLLAFIAWHTLSFRRRNTIRSIAEHLGANEEKATELACKSFQSTFKSFLEIGLTHKLGIKDIGTTLFIENEELWQRFRECERPIIVTTGYYGAWELLQSLLGEVHEAPRPRIIVSRKFSNPAIHRFVCKQREAKGTTMIGHRAVATSVLRALRKNAVVAFMVDHKTQKNEAYSLPFLGENATVNISAALFAVRSEALVLPVYLERIPEGFRLHLQEPLDTKLLTGTNTEKMHETALFYTKAMEKQIAINPKQWFWIHNRWNKKWD